MSTISISSKINRTICLDGKKFLYFSGTSYLGMASLPEFEELIVAGIRQYGSNYGASRSSNVQLAVYEQMEKFFASKAGAEKAAIMSSGYLSGYVTASVLQNIADEVWVASDTHPAILPEDLRPDPHQNFGRFRDYCVEASQKTRGRTIAIFANAVDPTTPCIHDFSWVNNLSQKNTYYLLLDDSHAFGVFGKGVYGTYSQWKNLPVHLIISGSLGKALSISAGIILGTAPFIQKITRNPIYIGASPPSPGFCQAFLDAQHLYMQQQEKLQMNMSYFFSLIKDWKGLHYDKQFPVLTFSHTGNAEKLKKMQLLISSFPYPSPNDQALDRIILSAYHQKEDLEKLWSSIKKISSGYSVDHPFSTL
jgi:7-keto-8-aminopelargonate synthetase-like enzyme